jgi:hypothetical protein
VCFCGDQKEPSRRYKLRTAGKEFAAERQGEIEATVKRMEADAAVGPGKDSKN